MPDQPAVGSIGWVDLTVPEAEELKGFYEQVAGWKPQPLSMGDYNDYVMTAGETGVAGICHRSGPNAAIPPVWLIYIVVADLSISLDLCAQLGGAVIMEPKGGPGEARYAVIRDPAGVVCALYQAAP
jgi:uncharacterized protein